MCCLFGPFEKKSENKKVSGTKKVRKVLLEMKKK